MSSQPLDRTIKITEDVFDRLSRLQGAVEFETGESVTLGEAIDIAASEFIQDQPRFVSPSEVERLKQQQAEHTVKVSTQTRRTLVRARGYIQFKTAKQARISEAVAISMDHYLDDFPLPL